MQTVVLSKGALSLALKTIRLLVSAETSQLRAGGGGCSTYKATEDVNIIII